jgi:hypothetical protein
MKMPSPAALLVDVKAPNELPPLNASIRAVN